MSDFFCGRGFSPDGSRLKPLPQVQGGVALVTAILVVALATISAATILTSANIAIHRTSSLQDSEAAWWVADGLESWVESILQRDRQANAVDSLDEEWAQPVDYLPVDQGFASGAVEDLQGRFNLNNLLAQQPQKYAAQFQRLADALGIDPGLGRELAAAMQDWVDRDQNPLFPGGAEDDVYLRLQPAYRTPDHAFSSITELLALNVSQEPKVLREAYLKLVTGCPVVEGRPAPCIAALSWTNAPTRININTASKPVLLSLSASPNVQAIDSFIQTRGQTPAQDTTQVIQNNSFGTGVDPADVAVGSENFMLSGSVVIGSSRVSLYSSIRRPANGPPLVLARSADTD